MNQPDQWTYNAEILRIVDGDTIDVLIRWDIGFKITTETKQRIRLASINAPETRGPQRQAGLAAKTWLQQQLPIGTTAQIHTRKGDEYDRFGRYLATIWTDTNPDTSLNSRMVDAGHATTRP